MADRAAFAEKLAGLNLSHLERAVALLWFYRETQEFDERSARELAEDLHEEALPLGNVSRLKDELAKSKFTVKGKRTGTFQIDLRRLAELTARFEKLLSSKIVKVKGAVVPPEWIAGTRKYLEQLVYQINGAYEYTFYDACAVLCRRLMESLIIDVYFKVGRENEIRDANGAFLKLEALLAIIRADKAIALGRNIPAQMDQIKTTGDTAAHDRTYITHVNDIDDMKPKIRRVIRELLDKAGIQPKSPATAAAQTN